MHEQDRKLRVCELPREIVKSVSPGANAHTGVAMGIKIAGEEVIVIARNVPELDIVFNYIEAHLRGGNAELMKTLRTEACPEVAVMLKDRLRFDDEL